MFVGGEHDIREPKIALCSTNTIKHTTGSRSDIISQYPAENLLLATIWWQEASKGVDCCC